LMRKLVLSEEVTRRAEKCGARLYAALAYNKRYVELLRSTKSHEVRSNTDTPESNHDAKYPPTFGI
jgi:hypothetical protein